MRCDDARDELELLALGALPEARRRGLESHLRACAECRAAEREYRRLTDAVRAGVPREAPRAGFEARLLAQVGASLRAERRRARMRRARRVAAAVAGVVALGLVVWRARQAGSGASPRVVEASERWSYASAQVIPASSADGVVVSGRTLYLVRSGSRGPRIVAVDGATGAGLWESGCESIGYLAADARRVYCLVPGRGGMVSLAALDAADGSTLWRYEQPPAHRLRGPSRPVPIAGGRVCWSAGGALHVLAAATGEPLWAQPFGSSGSLSAAVARGEALYVVSGQTLHCLSARAGHTLWQHRVEQPAGRGRPQLALDGERAYIARVRHGSGADLFCIDLATRSPVWRRGVPAPRCLLAAGGIVCLRGGPIVALDRDSGRQLWSRPAAGCGPLSYGDGLLHVVDSSSSGRLVALEPRTGRPVWELPGVHSCDAFARVGDTGYIKTRDGVVRALALHASRRF